MGDYSPIDKLCGPLPITPGPVFSLFPVAFISVVVYLLPS